MYKQKLSNENQKILVEMYKNKSSAKALSMKFQVSERTIRRVLSKFQCQLRKPQGKVKNINELKIKLTDLYIKQKLTISQCSKLIGLCPDTIHKYLKKFNIKINYSHTGKNRNGIGRYNQKGYILVYCPEHSRSNKAGYVFEHIVIMEKAIGRDLNYLSRGNGDNEIVHHKNGIKNDNRIENLEIKTQREHIRYHFMEKIKISYPKAEEIAEEIEKSDKSKNKIIEIIMKNINKE